MKNSSDNISIIDLSECQQKLIDNNKIKKDQNLYVIKLDIQKEGMKTPKVEYEVYTYSENLTLLNLSICENTRTNIILPININKNEIDLYNSSSDYYNDICESFTSEDGTDMHIKDRQKEYIENNMGICEEECYFSEYDFILRKAVCSCLTKTKNNLSEINLNTPRLYSNFKEVKNTANFELIKCFPKLFKKNKYRNNSANYIMFIIFLISIVSLVFFFIRKYKKIKNIIDEIDRTKRFKEKNPIMKEKKK